LIIAKSLTPRFLKHSVYCGPSAGTEYLFVCISIYLLIIRNVCGKALFTCSAAMNSFVLGTFPRTSAWDGFESRSDTSDNCKNINTAHRSRCVIY